MDTTTLAAVILIFLLCLGLHYATALPVVNGACDAAPVIPAPVIRLPVHPAVLRQNVAVLRFTGHRFVH
jgi:hypothetical protein